MPPGPAPCRLKILPRRRLPVASGGYVGSSPRVDTALSLSRHYRPFSALLNSQVGLVFSPRANGLLAALLDVRADELLGVLLEHLVDLVEDRVHVVGELLVPLLDLLGGRGLVLLGLLGTPRRLPLAPGILRRHLPFLRPS